MPDESKDLVKGLQKILDRDTTDKALVMISELLETLTMAIEKVGSASDQTAKTSKETTDRIAEAISKLSSLTKTPQVTVDIDLTPINITNQSILKAIEQMQSQQKSVLEAILQNRPEQSTPDWAPLYAMIENSNKLITSLTTTKPAPTTTGGSWDFEIERNGVGNRMSKIVATAK